jgi:hypothetical protein
MPFTNDFEGRARLDEEMKAAEIEKRKSNVIPLMAETEDYRVKLPSVCQRLLNLPFGLGAIQDYIFNRMIYPSRSVAGITAFAVLGHFAQKHLSLDSFGGLGFNEQYMILAGTTFGKEDVIKAFASLHDKFDCNYVTTSSVRYSAPASMQGLHQLLEDNRAQTFLSDEFAEWLEHTQNDGHKQQALSYLMQCYTKALGVVCPGNSLTTKYTPVRHPRVSLLTTSTIDKMMESLTESHAKSGAYNRFVVFIPEREPIKKCYEGQCYSPDYPVTDLLGWVQSRHEETVRFDYGAWETFKDIDQNKAEKFKAEDGVMAGRLSEQAIKWAGLIALSDRRMVINSDDLKLAYEIRFNLYFRAKGLLSHEGALSSDHVTVQAREQIIDVLKRKELIYKAQLSKFSRKFKALSINDQQIVINSLLRNGDAEQVGTGNKILKSLIYDS